MRRGEGEPLTIIDNSRGRLQPRTRGVAIAREEEQEKPFTVIENSAREENSKEERCRDRVRRRQNGMNVSGVKKRF